MQTLVKVRIKIEIDGRKAGEVAEYAASFARDLVAAGNAEYVTDDPKSQPFPHGRGRRDKMRRTVGGTT